MGSKLLGDIGRASGARLLFRSERFCESMSRCFSVLQTQTPFYACPATGDVSWDPPVGNFVCVFSVDVGSHDKLTCFATAYLQALMANGGNCAMTVEEVCHITITR